MENVRKGRQYRGNYEVPQPAEWEWSADVRREVKAILEEMGIPKEEHHQWLAIIENQFCHLAHAINLGTLQEVRLPKLGVFYPTIKKIRDEDFKHATFHGREFYGRYFRRGKKHSWDKRAVEKR